MVGRKEKSTLGSSTTGECNQSKKVGSADDRVVDEITKRLLIKHKKAFMELSK